MISDIIALLDRERIEVERLKELVAFLQRQCNESFEIGRLSGSQTASEVYAAQNELELLRTIRKSQGEAITKLRTQLNESCQERDAASKRANAWRTNCDRAEQELKDLRLKAADRNEWQDVAWKVSAERDRLQKEIDEIYKEMDRIRHMLNVSQAVNRITALKEKYNPRLESMLEESYRNEFKRNIDNQKATDGVSPNCPSS